MARVSSEISKDAVYILSYTDGTSIIMDDDEVEKYVRQLEAYRDYVKFQEDNGLQD